MLAFGTHLESVVGQAEPAVDDATRQPRTAICACGGSFYRRVCRGGSLANRAGTGAGTARSGWMLGQRGRWYRAAGARYNDDGGAVDSGPIDHDYLKHDSGRL